MLEAAFLLWPLHLFCVGLFALICGGDIAGLRQWRLSLRMILAAMLIVCLEFSILGIIIRHFHAF